MEGLDSILTANIRYRCIMCGRIWGNPEAADKEYSDGVCRVCYRERCKPLIHKRQLAEGFSQCYAEGYEDCSEVGCAFFDSCLERNIAEWEKLTIE